MKKKFFLIGALVVMSMSAMFVACGGKNEPEYVNGCRCEIFDEITTASGVTTRSTTVGEYPLDLTLQADGIFTCADLEDRIMYGNSGIREKQHTSVTCVGAKVEKTSSYPYLY